jgi:hypothetical protein
VSTKSRTTGLELELEVADPEPVQLRLLTGGSRRRDWVLDEQTRTVGRRGVAEARAILRSHQPPQPRDELSKAS